MRKCLITLAALAVLSVGNLESAFAAGDARQIRGVIADQCVACHEAPGFEASHRSVAAKAPSFQFIADNPEIYSDEDLRRFLRQPHYPMHQYSLSPSDIDNLIDYFTKLRQ